MQVPNNWGSIYDQTWWGDNDLATGYGMSYLEASQGRRYAIFVVDTTEAKESPSGQFAIKTAFSGGLPSGNIEIDWGDGTVETVPVADTNTHDYGVSGQFVVKFKYENVSDDPDTFSGGIRYNVNGGEQDKILRVVSFGKNPVATFSYYNGIYSPEVWGDQTFVPARGATLSWSVTFRSSGIDLCSGLSGLRWGIGARTSAFLGAATPSEEFLHESFFNNVREEVNAFSNCLNNGGDPINFNVAFNIDGWSVAPNLSNFLNASRGLTTSATDQTLKSYSEMNVPSGVTLELHNSKYSAEGKVYKDILEQTKGWTINTGGLET